MGQDFTQSGRQAAQRAFLDEVLAVVPICSYDGDVAEHHAALLAYTTRQGQRRRPHDHSQFRQLAAGIERCIGQRTRQQDWNDVVVAF